MASELYVETLKGLTSGANANKVIIPAGQTLDASAGTIIPSSGQVLNTDFYEWSTDTTVTSTTYTDTTNGSFTYTPVSDNSFLYITTSLSLNLRDDDGGQTGGTFRMLVDGTNIKGSGAAYEHYFDSGSSTVNAYIRTQRTFKISNSSTSGKLIKIQIAKYEENDQRIKINGDSQYYSTIFVQEVQA